MLPLLLCQLLFGAIIAFGPTIDYANRIAGLASVAISLVVSSATASSSTRRELKLGMLALLTTGLALCALRYTDGHALRNPFAAMAAGLMATSDDARLLGPHIIGLAIGAPALFLTSLAFYPGHPWLLRSLWFLGAASGVGIVGLSDSRDAAVAVATGMLVLTVSFLVKRRGAVIFTCALAIVAAGLGVLLFLGNEPRLQQRGELWVIALREVADSPALGLGYGGLSGIYRSDVPDPVTNAHNLFIQTSADFGAIGLVALILTVVFSVRAAIIDSRISPAVFRGFAASLAFVGVAGMAESIVDMTQRFPAADVTIVVPLLFVVLAVPLVPPPGRRHQTTPLVGITHKEVS